MNATCLYKSLAYLAVVPQGHLRGRPHHALRLHPGAAFPSSGGCGRAQGPAVGVANGGERAAQQFQVTLRVVVERKVPAGEAEDVQLAHVHGQRVARRLVADTICITIHMPTYNSTLHYITDIFIQMDLQLFYRLVVIVPGTMWG